jgi:hypothetical protein
MGKSRIERILFLDIDGVLNCASYVHSQTVRDDPRPFPLNTLDVSKVRYLNEVHVHRPYHIVVSSAWRIGRKLTELREILGTIGVQAPVLDKTPQLRSGYRGEEIQQWLQSTPTFTGPFVIVDDSSDLEPYMHRLVKTTWQDGLCAHHVAEIVDVLDSFARSPA